MTYAIRFSLLATTILIALATPRLAVAVTVRQEFLLPARLEQGQAQKDQVTYDQARLQGTGSALPPLRGNGLVPVGKPDAAPMMKTQNFNQWDQRWGQKRLSPSSWTMANSGCFITSLTNALPNFSIVKADGSPFDPGEVLDRLIAVDGLDAGGQMTYEGIMRAFPALYFHDRIYTTNDPRNNGVEMKSDVAIKKVRRLLDVGQPTILAVDNIGNDGWPDHAVLAKDYVLDASGTVVDFKISDPDGGRDITFTSKYGPLLTKLYGFVILVGPPIEFPDASTDQEEGMGLWKSAQIRQGKNVATYSKELIDSILSV